MFLTGFAPVKAKLLGVFNVLEVKPLIIFFSGNGFKLCFTAMFSSPYGMALCWDEEYYKYNSFCSALL